MGDRLSTPYTFSKWFVNDTDPALDASNDVLPMRGWIQMDGSFTNVLGVFLRNLDNTAWITVWVP